MQGKLRLKAHKLWSHLVVSFRKLPQNFLQAFAANFLRHWKIHAPFPELAWPVCTCSEIHNHIPYLNYKLKMAIYIEMHVSHVNFKNIYEKYSATNKTLLSADIYMIHPTRVCTKRLRFHNAFHVGLKVTEVTFCPLRN